MTVFEQALAFALNAHAGQTRKTGHTPYILHPAEVAAIAATLTDDPEVLAAAVLHDTVEDTAMTLDDIRKVFGDRVAALVAGDTENQYVGTPREKSWRTRKEQSFHHLRIASHDAKIIWMADKLSNMRSFYSLYLSEGDAMWEHFNQRDKNEQRWYYHTVAELLKEFSDTPAYREYMYRMNVIFGEEV